MVYSLGLWSYRAGQGAMYGHNSNSARSWRHFPDRLRRYLRIYWRRAKFVIAVCVFNVKIKYDIRFFLYDVISIILMAQFQYLFILKGVWWPRQTQNINNLICKKIAGRNVHVELWKLRARQPVKLLEFLINLMMQNRAMSKSYFQKYANLYLIYIYWPQQTIDCRATAFRHLATLLCYAPMSWSESWLVVPFPVVTTWENKEQQKNALPFTAHSVSSNALFFFFFFFVRIVY